MYPITVGTMDSKRVETEVANNVAAKSPGAQRSYLWLLLLLFNVQVLRASAVSVVGNLKNIIACNQLD